MFQPTVSEQERRLRFFRQLSVPMIRPLLDFRHPFPPEIGLSIAGYCPGLLFRHLRILYALGCLADTAANAIESSAPGARHVRFEGRPYVAAAGEDVARLAEETAGDSRDHGVAVGLDYSGVRSIVKRGELPTGLESEDVWWRTVPARDEVLAVEYATDVRPAPASWPSMPWKASLLTRRPGRQAS
jgi:hypothetical protein